MNKIVDELKQTGIFYISTIDGDKPRVRPFSSVCDFEGKVYLCTNNKKNFWKQIEKNSNVEICGMQKGGTWIRVTGKLVRDDRLEAKKFMLEDPTGPSNLYKYDDEIYEVMYLDEAVCTKYSFNSEPVIIKE